MKLALFFVMCLLFVCWTMEFRPRSKSWFWVRLMLRHRRDIWRVSKLCASLRKELAEVRTKARREISRLRDEVYYSGEMLHACECDLRSLQRTLKALEADRNDKVDRLQSLRTQLKRLEAREHEMRSKWVVAADERNGFKILLAEKEKELARYKERYDRARDYLGKPTSAKVGCAKCDRGDGRRGHSDACINNRLFYRSWKIDRPFPENFVREGEFEVIQPGFMMTKVEFLETYKREGIEFDPALVSPYS